VGRQGKRAETRGKKRRAASQVLHIVLITLFCLICGSVPLLSQSSLSSGRETGRIAGVRSVSRAMLLYATRSSRIHDFDVYFSLRAGQATYCVDYETVVLDEIQDLASSEGKELGISLDTRKNKVVLYTLQSRKLKARLVRSDLCKPPAVVHSILH
jgi:hypothetical protein